MYRPPSLPPRSGGMYASTSVGFCYAPSSIHSTNARAHTHTRWSAAGGGAAAAKVEKKTSLYVGKIPEGMADEHIKALLEVFPTHSTPCCCSRGVLVQQQEHCNDWANRLAESVWIPHTILSC